MEWSPSFSVFDNRILAKTFAMNISPLTLTFMDIYYLKFLITTLRLRGFLGRGVELTTSVGVTNCVWNSLGTIWEFSGAQGL